MIHRFKAVQFGCIQDVTLSLTKVHAFIGPNDSGKSTLLQAIRTAAQLALGNARSAVDPRFGSAAHLHATADAGSYSAKWHDSKLVESWSDGTNTLDEEQPLGTVRKRRDGWQKDIVAAVAGEALVRFDAAAMRLASPLIPEREQARFIDDSGRGLPGIYQVILGRGDDAFHKIRDSVRRLFPTVRTIRVSPQSQTELVLEAELHDGTRVRPEHMSDGLLYYLAFAAIPYLTRVAVLLIEEPENGLHPARVGEVVRLIREFALESGTQVVMATHSPLVVNELTGDEVTVVTRSLERGTQVRVIKDTPHFERRSKVAELGELWLSYANGVDESPLLAPDSSAA